MVRADVRSLILLVVGTAGISCTAVGGVDGPVGMPASQDLGEAQSGGIYEYWTPARLISAQAVPAPFRAFSDAQLSEALSEADPISDPPTFTSGWDPDSKAPQPTPGTVYTLDSLTSVSDYATQTFGTAPSNPKDGPYARFQRWTMHGRYDMWPRSVHGRLFFSRLGRDYACSGTVIGRSVVATAAHCLTDGSGNWSTNYLFCPGYSQSGAMPGVGCWGVRGLWVTGPFAASADVDYDYGCLVTDRVGSQFGGEIGDRTGWSGIAWNWHSSQLIVAFGYPATAPFDGRTIQQVASTEWYELDTRRGGQVSKYIGGDLAGANGGGWFINWRHPTTEYPDTDGGSAWPTDPGNPATGPWLNGITSHSRCRTNCNRPPSASSGVFWQEMGSAVFRSTESDINDAMDIFGLCWDDQ